MQIGADSGEGASVQAPAPSNDDVMGEFARDSSFAVIHDEPFLTIVYDEGVFRGTVVNPSLDKLAAARKVAAQYNLEIYHLRVDYYGSFDIYLREVRGPDTYVIAGHN